MSPGSRPCRRPTKSARPPKRGRASDLPYTYTGSFDTAGKTMMGLHPRDIHGVAESVAERPLAVGANCGVGAADILAIAARHERGASPTRPSSSRAIAAFPNSTATRSTIPARPKLMARYVRLAIDGGATIIGGCCGTSFEHLAAMRRAMDSHQQACPSHDRGDRRGDRPTAQQTGRPRPVRNHAASAAADAEGHNQKPGKIVQRHQVVKRS